MHFESVAGDPEGSEGRVARQRKRVDHFQRFFLLRPENVLDGEMRTRRENAPGQPQPLHSQAKGFLARRRNRSKIGCCTAHFLLLLRRLAIGAQVTNLPHMLKLTHYVPFPLPAGCKLRASSSIASRICRVRQGLTSLRVKT